MLRLILSVTVLASLLGCGGDGKAKKLPNTEYVTGKVTLDDKPLADAIVTFAGIQKVFTVKDGKAAETSVVVGRRSDDWVVVEGLPANTPVVLAPGNLVSGQPVTVSK